MPRKIRYSTGENSPCCVKLLIICKKKRNKHANFNDTIKKLKYKGLNIVRKLLSHLCIWHEIIKSSNENYKCYNKIIYSFIF